MLTQRFFCISMEKYTTSEYVIQHTVTYSTQSRTAHSHIQHTVTYSTQSHTAHSHTQHTVTHTQSHYITQSHTNICNTNICIEYRCTCTLYMYMCTTARVHLFQKTSTFIHSSSLIIIIIIITMYYYYFCFFSHNWMML